MYHEYAKMYKSCVEQKAGSWNKTVKPYNLNKKNFNYVSYISATCTVKYFRKNANAKKRLIM